MGHLPAIADVSRITFEWNAGGQSAVNVTHVYAPGKTSAEIFTAIDAAVVADMWDAVSSSAAVLNVKVLPLDGTSATLSFAPISAHWAGIGGADYMPQGAALIKLGTGLRGPAKRGRVFLPFLAENQQSNGLVTPASVSQMTTAWVGYSNSIAAAGVHLVVASYKHASSQAVTQIICEHEIGTQRRRQQRNR